jgi:hypothetical protein
MKFDQIEFELKKITIAPGEVVFITCESKLDIKDRNELIDRISKIGLEQSVVILTDGLQLGA